MYNKSSCSLFPTNALISESFQKKADNPWLLLLQPPPPLPSIRPAGLTSVPHHTISLHTVWQPLREEQPRRRTRSLGPKSGVSNNRSSVFKQTLGRQFGDSLVTDRTHLWVLTNCQAWVEFPRNSLLLLHCALKEQTYNQRMTVIFLIPSDHFVDKETETQKDETMLPNRGSTRNQMQVCLNPKSTFLTTTP